MYKSARLHFLKMGLLAITLWILVYLHTVKSTIYEYMQLDSHTGYASLSFIVDTGVNQSVRAQKVNYSESTNLEYPNKRLTTVPGIQIGRYVENCGLPEACPFDHYSLHLDTGLQNTVLPTLCIDDKVILGKDLNGCGRGINMVVIDNLDSRIVKVANFDVYQQDSSLFVNALLTTRKGDTIILLTHDEPSAKLSSTARLLLHDLGSSQAQNLQFRSSWYFIATKGINGYTPYEEVNFPSDDDSWPEPQNITICLPVQISGIMVRPDPSVVDNQARVNFCDKYNDNFPNFCNNLIVNDALINSKILKTLPVSPAIHYTPLIVITSECSSTYLPLLMETIIRQPEVNMSNVFITYDPHTCSLVPKLEQLFAFKTFPVANLPDQELSSVITSLAPDSFQQYIVIEDSVVLSSDFFTYFGQLIPLLDGTGISAISGWNENSVNSISGDISLIYRVSHYPLRYAFMILNIIIPDVSRVYYANDPRPISNMNVCMDEEVLLENVKDAFTPHTYHTSLIEQYERSIQFVDIHEFLRYIKENAKISNDSSFTFIATSPSQWVAYCGHFEIPYCIPHQTIESLGSVFRFTLNSTIKSMIVLKSLF